MSPGRGRHCWSGILTAGFTMVSARCAASVAITTRRGCFIGVQCTRPFSAHLASALPPSFTGTTAAADRPLRARGGWHTNAHARAQRSVSMMASSSSSSSSSSGFTLSTPHAIAKLHAPGGDGEDFSGDLLVLPVFQAEEGDNVVDVSSQPLLAAWDAKLDGAIADLIAQKDFKGKPGSSARVRLSKSSPTKSLSIVGLGKKSALKDAAFKGVGSTVAGDIKAEKPKTVAVVFPEQGGDSALSLAAEELLGGLYVDNRFKTGDRVDKRIEVESVSFYGGSFSPSSSAIAAAEALASGIRLTKDLVNAPANYATPLALADTARDIGKESGGAFEVKVLNADECRTYGMTSYLAVAQGSILEPYFIHMTYKPEGEVKKRLVLIGKGLTFDSGGYNLKAGAGSMIELMKFDMGGAGAVLGAAKALSQLKPKGVEVHVIVAACENMISDRAYRPGDILNAANGKTIEVLNTDAEGRLTLCDALVYAEKECKPDAIVDAATLTGACIVALGGEYAGLWSTNDELANAIEAAAKAKGEKLWRMPLAEEYKPNLKSDIADLKNIGGREGGSITAALFLSEFVSSKIPWAHLDIAGPVWSGKKGGATGYGVRTLTEWVLSHADRSRVKQLEEGMPQVIYHASMWDDCENKQEFTWERSITDSQLRAAREGRMDATRDVLTTTVRNQYTQMLRAKQWRCQRCGTLATGLSCHPMSYLHLPEPRIEDMPQPFCSKACEAALNEDFHAMTLEVTGLRPGT